MKFWDSSAVVPLLVEEAASRSMRQFLGGDGSIVVWWGTPVECVSAIARREREASLIADAVNSALERFRVFQSSWTEINASSKVRDIALRLLRTHSLRGSDSLQLAAAIVASDDDPGNLGFVCLDERLITAARREGFAVLP